MTEAKYWCVKKEGVNLYAVRGAAGQYLARLSTQEFADRLCALVNDSPAKINREWRDMTDEDNWRLCSTLEVFRLQEDLTWEDLDIPLDAIQTIKAILGRGCPFQGISNRRAQTR